MSSAKNKNITVFIVALGMVVVLIFAALVLKRPLIDWYYLWKFPWGKPVDGIQIRLRPDKRVWDNGEDPSFTLYLRNRGSRELSTSSICSQVIEVDGKPFTPKAWHRTGDIEREPFGPGIEYSFTFSLGQFGSFRWSEERRHGGEVLLPGRHTIKVTLLNNIRKNGFDTTLARYQEMALAFSNLVEIEVVGNL